MTFENNKAIYEQMADRLCDEIIAKTYKADDRILRKGVCCHLASEHQYGS